MSDQYTHSSTIWTRRTKAERERERSQVIELDPSNTATTLVSEAKHTTLANDQVVAQQLWQSLYYPLLASLATRHKKTTLLAFACERIGGSARLLQYQSF